MQGAWASTAPTEPFEKGKKPMSNKLLKHAGIAVMLCSALAGSVMAQTDPWIANEISRQNQRNLEADNKIRAQRARERQLQIEIAELRRTPFYQAIAYDLKTERITWGGYYSEKRAIETAMSRCGTSNCHLVTTFNNTCAGIANPDSGIKSSADLFVAFDNDERQAIVKSVRACEAQYGHNKCSYWIVKPKAFCTGYDYSIYGQK